MLPQDVSIFREALLAWYRANARDLPWRRTCDPYLIWISEIMLQQTRVAAVLDHYARFTARFPTVHHLARSSEADVLAQWSGLGYYRRARMMHRAAQTIVAEHGGVFSSTADRLLKLPGIGLYTAAAIASIAFNEPVAVVDGNVERVLTRIAALDTQPDATTDSKPAPQQSIVTRIRALAGELIDPAEPSHFNQAMMELGATVCLPRAPLCLQCPLQRLCRTRGEHLTVARKPLQPLNAFYTLLEQESFGELEVLLEQRPAAASQMAGMWQLPELSGAPDDGELLCTIKHAITVTNYTVRVYAGAGGFRNPWPRQWISLHGTSSLPLTGLARKILRRLRVPGLPAPSLMPVGQNADPKVT